MTKNAWNSYPICCNLPETTDSRKFRDVQIISGKTGKVQGRPYLVEQCTDLNVLNVTSNLELQFDCQGLSGRKYA